MKNAILFVIKYAFAIFLLWLFLLVLNLFGYLLAAIWKFLLAVLVAICAYLVITGKYKGLDEIFDSLIATIKKPTEE